LNKYKDLNTFSDEFSHENETNHKIVYCAGNEQLTEEIE